MRKIVYYYILYFFSYFFILATDWFCAIYFRWVNIWLGKLYIFVFHIFLVIFSSWQLIDFASYISGGKIFDEKNCIFLYSNGCLKKLSFTELSICRFATNIIGISSLAAGSPNAQFGKTQFFWDTLYYVLICSFYPSIIFINEWNSLPALQCTLAFV